MDTTPAEDRMPEDSNFGTHERRARRHRKRQLAMCAAHMLSGTESGQRSRNLGKLLNPLVPNGVSSRAGVPGMMGGKDKAQLFVDHMSASAGWS